MMTYSGDLWIYDVDILPELQLKWIAVTLRQNEFDDFLSIQLEAMNLGLIMGNLVGVVGAVWPPIIIR